MALCVIVTRPGVVNDPGRRTVLGKIVAFIVATEGA
jgi:hypothetical protein